MLCLGAVGVCTNDTVVGLNPGWAFPVWSWPVLALDPSSSQNHVFEVGRGGFCVLLPVEGLPAFTLGQGPVTPHSVQTSILF